MRQNDFIALVTLKVSLSWLTGDRSQHTRPKFVELVNRPFVNLRQAKLFETLHCSEKLRFASCTSMNSEQTCVIRIRTVNLLTLILDPARHLQIKHLGMGPILQSSLLISHITELPEVFGLIHFTCINISSLFVTSCVPFCY